MHHVCGYARWSESVLLLVFGLVEAVDGPVAQLARADKVEQFGEFWFELAVEQEPAGHVDQRVEGALGRLGQASGGRAAEHGQGVAVTWGLVSRRPLAWM
jgi:hypothetical protein